MCGEAGVGRSAVLDVALAEAVRADTDLVAHSSGVDYGAWVRTLADRIEMEFPSAERGRRPRRVSLTAEHPPEKRHVFEVSNRRVVEGGGPPSARPAVRDTGISPRRKPVWPAYDRCDLAPMAVRLGRFELHRPQGEADQRGRPLILPRSTAELRSRTESQVRAAATRGRKDA